MLKSNIDQKTILEFWEHQHKTQNMYFLGNTSPKGELSLLKLHPKKEMKILIVGVGTGQSARYLFEMGCEVHALDISKIALDSCKKYLVNGVTTPEELPTDKYDLAISHLVTQHLTNVELYNQLRHVLRSLNKDGIYAMQFARSLTGGFYVEDLHSQQHGKILRTLDAMKKIIYETGGEVVMEIPSKSVEDTYRNVLHIKRGI